MDTGIGPEPEPEPEPNGRDIIRRVIMDPGNLKPLTKLCRNNWLTRCKNTKELSKARRELVCVKEALRQHRVDGNRKCQQKLTKLHEHIADVLRQNREIQTQQQVKYDEKIKLMNNILKNKTIAKLRAMTDEYETRKKGICEKFEDFRKEQQKIIVDANQVMLKKMTDDEEKLTKHVKKNAIDPEECQECVICMDDVNPANSIRYNNLGNNEDGVRCICRSCFAQCIQSEETIFFPSSNDRIPLSLVCKFCPDLVDAFQRIVNEKACATAIDEYKCEQAKLSEIDKLFETVSNHLNDRTPCCGQMYGFSGCCAIVCPECRTFFCHVCKESYEMDLFADMDTDMDADKRAHQCVKNCLEKGKHESHSVYYLTAEGMKTMASDKKSLEIAALLRNIPSEQVEPLAQRIIDAKLLRGVILQNDMHRLAEECPLFEELQLPEPEAQLPDDKPNVRYDLDMAIGMLHDLPDPDDY